MGLWGAARDWFEDVSDVDSQSHQQVREALLMAHYVQDYFTIRRFILSKSKGTSGSQIMRLSHSTTLIDIGRRIWHSDWSSLADEQSGSWLRYFLHLAHDPTSFDRH